MYHNLWNLYYRYSSITQKSNSSKGDVTLVNLQRQLATPIRNTCFSHKFADIFTLLIAFKNFQRVAALQISKKIVRNGVLR